MKNQARHQFCEEALGNHEKVIKNRYLAIPNLFPSSKSLAAARFRPKLSVSDQRTTM
jgi:hypothetical protein